MSITALALIILLVLAAAGWAACWCAQDQAAGVVVERDQVRADLREVRKAGRKAAASSLRHAVAAEKAQNRAATLQLELDAEREWAAILAATSLPVAPVRTADPTIAAPEFRGKFVPPAGDEGVLVALPERKRAKR